LAAAGAARGLARSLSCAMEIGDLRVEGECHRFDRVNERLGLIGTDD
jgi:hypothetical protein